ncbi:SusC/RagA family TonB-linked outer membrane protein [Pseudobacter ginsenosidimutans]|uniref:TonB-linked SusC/RagA family outer membrane protein n=1 Tax=Pseudobacter ginsenosidimutans TaxID=661488 RepID=A0A4Q7M8R3_9BACT|nr:SusC/RagA family TonB-linked outer membrane protein [Pseudobacter ginsenosidimutans]QEC42516.1 SusC/RagA family TonB-linked outer membrane protein [Pseudobacter ginsenosidimutans]RZS64001.1 TonB-linked SusC/RagA family outer membrane protein [Pseudobacter ginsenosidimutans]
MHLTCKNAGLRRHSIQLPGAQQTPGGPAVFSPFPRLQQTLRIMRLLMFFMLAGFLQVSASGVSQTVTLSMRKAPAEKVFRSIEQQTGFTFIVFKKDLEKMPSVTLRLENTPLKDALDQCFEHSPFTYIIDDKNIIVQAKQPASLAFPPLYPTYIVYNGVVKGPNGQQLPGVNIQVKGTQTGTVTNNDGAFSINANPGNILVISAIGYETVEHKLVSNDTSITIVMKIKTNIMDTSVVTVVNTGYQSFNRDRATGSFGYIGSVDLDRQIGAIDITQKFLMLPGVQLVNGNPIIRGKSSLNASQSPLLVIDGFASELGYSSINPNDVESITILRDASAASIWGARASNGVIVITTKQAKKGSGPPVFSFSSSIQFLEMPEIEALRIANSSQLVDVEIEALDKGWYNTNNPENNVGYSRAYEIYRNRKNNVISEEEAKKQYDVLRNNDAWSQKDLFFRTGLLTNQHLSVSGATNQNRYYISMNYQDNKTTARQTEYKRMNLLVKNSYQIIPQLRFDADLNITYQKGMNNGLSTYDFVRQRRYEMFLDENGNYVPVYEPYRTIQRNQELMNKGYLDWNKNLKRDFDNFDKTWSIFAPRINFTLAWNATRALSFETKFQYERTENRNDDYQNLEIYNTRRLINEFTIIGSDNKPVNQLPSGPIFYQNNSSIQAINWRNQVKFDKEWNGSQHRVNILAGTEISRVRTLERKDRYHNYDKQRLTYSQIDADKLAGGVTGWNGGNLNYAPIFQPVVDKENRQFSMYANGSYTYDDRYIVSASGRIDKSNLFGATTNDKMTPLYSFGLAWNLSKEKFFRADFINNLKLRATIGLNGNIDRLTSKVLVGIPRTNDYSTGEDYLDIEFPENSKLRWESTRSTNFGADIDLFNHRLEISADYYIKKSYDLLGYVQADPSVGFEKVYKNTAEVSNKGIDIRISGDILRKGDLRWTSTLNLSLNKNKVTKVYVPTPSMDTYLTGGKSREKEGKPIDYFYSYNWAGLNGNGEPMAYNDKGEKVPWSTSQTPKLEWLVYSGSTVPNVFGSFMNVISWKRFTLTPIFTYQFGAVMRAPVTYVRSGIPVLEDISTRWRKAGDENITNLPGLFTTANEPYQRRLFYAQNSSRVVSADFVRLSVLSLSYNLPQRWTGNIFRNIQLAAQGTNVFLWKKNDLGIDPEAITRNSGDLSLPEVKTWTIQLKLDF